MPTSIHASSGYFNSAYGLDIGASVQGFINSGNQDYMLDNLRWIADYFVKCHYAPEVFTGQVGDTNTDHALWERAEDMSESRPSADITPTAPGQCHSLCSLCASIEDLQLLWPVSLHSSLPDSYAGIVTQSQRTVHCQRV
jgi:hypothetical protein